MMTALPKPVHRALLAGMTMIPAHAFAQDVGAKGGPQFGEPKFVTPVVCLFEPTDPNSSVHAAVTAMQGSSQAAMTFLPGDVVISFKDHAEFLVRNQEVQRLPDTPALKSMEHSKELTAALEEIPELLRKCETAQTALGRLPRVQGPQL